MANWLTSWLTDWLIVLLTGWLIYCFINWVFNVNWPPKRVSELTFRMLVTRLIGWVADWLIDWNTQWRTRGLLSEWNGKTTVEDSTSYSFHHLPIGNILIDGQRIQRKPLFSVTVALWLKLNTNRGQQSVFSTCNPDNPWNTHQQYSLTIKDGRVRWFHRNEKSQVSFYKT